MGLSDNTIYRTVCATAQRFPERPALRYKRGNAYERLTYCELLKQARALRASLDALGVRRGDRVAILSYNRPEWAVCDLAIQALGAITVPIYHTLPAAQVRHYLSDSGATMIFVEDHRQLAKLDPTMERLTIAMIDGHESSGIPTVADMLGQPRSDAHHDAALDEAERSVSPDDIATFIYTSGTTGAPKGAMLSHRALLYTTEAALQFVTIDQRDVFLSFLPLCHVVERVGGYYLPLSVGAEIVYSQGPFAVAGEIAEVQPTAFICVPRLYDTVRERVTDTLTRLRPVPRRIAHWALAIGRRAAKRRLDGASLALVDRVLTPVADRLVLHKIRQRATGGRVRFLVSGGAPLSPETGFFFESIGVRILEGYGLTEFPVISINRPETARIGSVGTPLPGVEVRLGSDGEILARGPSMMRGYHNLPEETAHVIDADGWFHTGDIGAIDTDDRITITERIKDIIVLANGKNVAPQPIEARLKESPYIAEAVLFGDGQAVVVALILPAREPVEAWAAARGIQVGWDNGALCDSPDLHGLIKAEIAQQSEELADFERIRRFALIGRPFSIETGELTPTLKVRRRAVAEQYADILREMQR